MSNAVKCQITVRIIMSDLTQPALSCDIASLFFLKKFRKTEVLFVGPLIPLFWTSGDVSSGFQSQSRQHCSHLAEVYVLRVP